MEEDYKDEGSTEDDIKKESNKYEGKILDCVKTGSGGFFASSRDNNCEGGINSMIGGGGQINPQALCGIGTNDINKDYAQCGACIGCDSLS